MDIPLILVSMLICLILEGFFSGSEIGVVSADRMKLRHKASKGDKGAKLALKMLEKPEWLLSTTLVGTNIAIVTNTSLATLLAVQLLGLEYSWVAIVVVAPLIWVFGEIVPKSIFQQRSDVITPRIIFILKGASYLFYPALLVFTAITKLLTRLAGGQQQQSITLRKEIDMMLQMSAEGGDVKPEEKNMIRRMFNFGETKVRDIAVPLIDVISISNAATCTEAFQLAWNKSHPRLPVYEGQSYRIIGMINTVDFLANRCRMDPKNQGMDLSIKPFIKPVRFVAGSKSIEDLLREMRESGDRLAIVVDEFGAAQGIVTLEDILERIVGTFDDEYDKHQPISKLVHQEADKILLANPRVDLITLNDEWGLDIPDGAYETLGGFLMEQAEDIPKKGQKILFRNLTFTIVRATDKAVQEIRVEW